MGKIISAHIDDNLAQIIHDAGIPLNNLCGNKGLCGKCKIKTKSGKVPNISEKERFLLGKRSPQAGFRLACNISVKSDMSIHIPPNSLLAEIKGLKKGLIHLEELEPPVKKFPFPLVTPTISHPVSIIANIEKYFKKQNFSLAPHVWKSIASISGEHHSSATAVFYDGRELITLEKGDTSGSNFGLAVDIGTTTVALELVDLNNGKDIDSYIQANGQISRGGDIITRIGYAIQSHEKLISLKKAIQDTLEKMIVHILEKNHISPAHIYAVTIAGNTVMNHLFLGFPVESLARAPFFPLMDRFPLYSAEELALPINPSAKIFIAPNIKSFIGGDISSGLTACSFFSRKGNFIFIDLGTNGEIVLKKRGTYTATSTAAGPAFEGMNISCGMLAQPGAVYKARFKQGLQISTITGKKACGICGTGLIDLLSLFLANGTISPSGKILEKDGKIKITNDLFLIQKDIREIQLAVAAVKTGVKMILDKAGLIPGQVDGIFLAGAFGNYLNVENSIRIGLLPDIKKEKIFFIGNSSLAGARILLLSRKARRDIYSQIKKIRFYSLASDTSFQDRFIQSLEFNKY